MRIQTGPRFGINHDLRISSKHVLKCTKPSEMAETMKWKIQEGTTQDQNAIREMIFREG